MTYNSVEGLEVLVLPRIAGMLAEMVRDGVVDPVNALRRLQGGSDEPELRSYAATFRTLRGLYVFDGNEKILEQAMRQAVDLAASVVI
jgi:hypothetical protein